MILIFTGNGKGKTTAAIGQAVRAIGCGKKVLMIQFIKSLEWSSGEEKIAHRLEPFFEIKKFGLGFIIPRNTDLRSHKKAAERGWEYAKREIKSGQWDIIILDEINVVVNLGLLKTRDIVTFFSGHKDKPVIIFTGRGAPKSFIKIADLATEMKEIKHQYARGVFAQKGLEY